jgi:hypothetical protein
MTMHNASFLNLNCDSIEELLPLYVLDVLDVSEAIAVETHLATCLACSAARSQFEAVTGSLPFALAPVEPDPSVRTRLLDQLDAGAPAANVTPLAPRSEARGRAWRSYAAAAVLLLTLGGAGIWINNLMEERDEARDTLAMVQDFVAPSALTVSLEPMPSSEYEWGWGSSRLFKNPDGEMMLVVEGCPPTTEDRSYPVWVSTDDHRTLLGEIVIHDDGRGWMEVSFPDDAPEPEMLGVSVLEGDDQLVDLFLAEMAG